MNIGISCLFSNNLNWNTRSFAIIKNENTTICTYCAACSKGEFIDNWKKEQIENYLNEPGRLYGIFPTTGKLSEQDIEELRKLL